MSYRKITATDCRELAKICPGRVFSGPEINEDFTHDEMVEYGKFAPEVVIEALTTEEVAAVMQYASRHQLPVTPRGSGTGLCGGAVALYGGIVLSLAKMDRILELDEANLTVTTQPGVLLMDLAKAVAEKELFYPPDPGEKTATIGGNVMTNAGGMRAVKYGVTRDYVRGLEVVLPSGEIVEFGGKVAKNSSGYSLKDLMVGSEGTLGIVTRITLRLIPLPKLVVSLLVPFADLAACIETVPQIIRSKAQPTAIEFMEREVIEAAEEYLGKQFPDKSANAYLLLTFDGNSAAELDRQCDLVARLCLEAGAVDVLLSNTEERQEAIWSARGAFLEAIKSSTPEMDECDVVVPAYQVARFVKYVKELGRTHEIRIRSFGHAGDGNLHIYVCRDRLSEQAWRTKLAQVMQLLYEKARELGGQVSGEHGVGHAKVGFLKAALGETTIQLMQGVKRAFDPGNILNPGKVCREREIPVDFR